MINEEECEENSPKCVKGYCNIMHNDSVFIGYWNSNQYSNGDYHK